MKVGVNMRKEYSKYKKILIIHLIIETVLLLSCIILLELPKKYLFINILLSIFLIINSIITFIYSTLTYNRNSADDFLWGFRWEASLFLLVSIVLAIVLICSSIN